MLQSTCFVIGPIGDEGSTIRMNADKLFNELIRPAIRSFEMNPIRSDQIHESGKLSEQMFAALFGATLCIVDLAGRNPNVYYELALAQMACKPVIILTPLAEPLPFDIQDFRTVNYNPDNPAASADTLSKFISAAKEVNWQVDDLFSKYQAKKIVAAEPVPFDQVTGMEEKTTVYKIINLLSVSKNNDQPVYNRYIPRIEKNITVYSEVMATLITRFNQPVINFTHGHRTSGDAIELEGLLPFDISLSDNDSNDTVINPVIEGPSSVFVNQMHTYNGFKDGNLELSTKSEKDVAIVNFVVDISSIPGYEQIVKPRPRLFHFFTSDQKKSASVELPFESQGDGIFYCTFKNLKKDEVLRFVFEPA